ncbi:MAG: ribbon-helix-helix protein, CopG family [Terriglobia bacterium]
MSAKARINITVDRETLRLADREARRRRTSRSEFIRTAVRAEAARNDAAGKEQALRRQRHEAFQAIRRIAKEAGNWPAVKIVHDWRYRLVNEKK